MELFSGCWGTAQAAQLYLCFKFQQTEQTNLNLNPQTNEFCCCVSVHCLVDHQEEHQISFAAPEPPDATYNRRTPPPLQAAAERRPPLPPVRLPRPCASSRDPAPPPTQPFTPALEAVGASCCTARGDEGERKGEARVQTWELQRPRAVRKKGNERRGRENKGEGGERMPLFPFTCARPSLDRLVCPIRPDASVQHLLRIYLRGWPYPIPALQPNTYKNRAAISYPGKTHHPNTSLVDQYWFWTPF